MIDCYTNGARYNVFPFFAQHSLFLIFLLVFPPNLFPHYALEHDQAGGTRQKLSRAVG